MPKPTPVQIQNYINGRLKFASRADEEGWRKAHCPRSEAHEHGDQNPSCSFNVNSGYLKCHACGLEGLIGKIYSELGWPPPPWNNYQSSIEMEGLPSVDWKNRLITRWEHYTDENGRILYSKARVDFVNSKNKKTKEFFFWAGGSWGIKGKQIQRVPFHLDRLKSADEVLVVEGESDVRAAEELGFVATTIDNGANGDPDLLVEFIKPEQRIVVLVDQDNPGDKFRKKIIEALYGKVGSLKSIYLPDMPQGKKDLRDWVDTRRNDLAGAAERLSIIIEGTEEWKSTHDSTQADPYKCDSMDEALTLQDFYAYMPQHSYIFVDGRTLWPAASVNARIEAVDSDGKPMKATTWLDKYRAVEQMTWAPGKPILIQDRLIQEGGWIDRPGVNCFNLYRPPQISLGDPSKAEPWLEHVYRVYGPDAEHILRWLACRVQKPQIKINHALVFGGEQGIGKDTILEPVKFSVGPWNFCEVSPVNLLGRFNGFVKSVILRINEARDLGEIDRYGFYDHLKAYAAAPPDVLRCDEKNIREYYIPNVCGLVITTNYKSNGIYLPSDDRRHYVAWSDCKRDDFPENYWKSLYDWFDHGGNSHVAAYLHSKDISSFDPKSPPPKTDAFWAIVDANQAPEDAELSDVLDKLGNPNAVTLETIASNSSSSDFTDWLRDRRNRRQIPHRMESVGYIPVRNEMAKDHLWKLEGKRQVIYALKELSLRERIVAATELTEWSYQ